jgi:signal transduction histidine kinase
MYGKPERDMKPSNRCFPFPCERRVFCTTASDFSQNLEAAQEIYEKGVVSLKASTHSYGYRRRTEVNEQMQKVVVQLLKQCIDEFDVDSGSVFTKDPKKHVLRLTKALGPRRNHHYGKEIGVGRGVTGTVAARRRPLYLCDESAKLGLEHRKNEGLRHFLSFPIISGAEVLAVVNLSGPKNGRKFGKQEIRKCKMLAKKYARILNPVIVRRPLLPPEKSCYKIIGGNRAHQKKSECDERDRAYLLHSVLFFDSSFMITCCNRAEGLGKLFGSPEAADKCRRSLLELPLEIEKEHLQERLEDLRDRRFAFKLENVRVRGLSGQPTINMYFYPADTADEAPCGGIAVLEDATGRFEAQGRLIEMERLSLIGGLISIITHELSNPLDGVIRLIKLTRANLRETETVDEYLEQAQQGLHRMGALMKSLTGFSRMNAEPGRLNVLIENALALCRYRKGDRDILFQLHLDPENLQVNANDFHQIITNLLSNAIDAIIAKSGTVKVETDVDDSCLHLIVSDNGCGIPHAVQPRIFDPFWTTKEQGRGTGLGLSIVKKIVERHGGTITVKSGENAGATFYLKFPKDRLIIQ